MLLKQARATKSPQEPRPEHSEPRHRAGFPAALRYRVGQFVQGFHAQVDETERALVAELLPPAALLLFSRMPVDAQRHSLNVLYAVQAASVADPDLAAAALLHDAGKVRGEAGPGEATVLGLWWRGPLVILERVAPHWLARWASSTPQPGVHHLLYLHLHHPRLGAAAARAAGCSEVCCRLIAHHQDKYLPHKASLRAAEHERPTLAGAHAQGVYTPRFWELLRILQWADSRN